MVSLSPFGLLLREWRNRRGLSQLGLANAIGTSPRHISFIETGRSRPGRDLVLRLATHLDVPHRERNALLSAAGLSPVYLERSLDDVDLTPYRQAIEAVLENHNPYPATAVDRWGTVLKANDGARRLTPDIEQYTPERAQDALLGPGPARETILNWEEVAWAYVDRLERSAAANPDDQTIALLKRAQQHMIEVDRPPIAPDSAASLTIRLNFGGKTLSFFSTVMRFDQPYDITLSDVVIELVFPLDDATAACLAAPFD